MVFASYDFVSWVHLVSYEIAWIVVCWAIFDLLTASNLWHYFFCTFDPRAIFEKWFSCFTIILRYTVLMVHTGTAFQKESYDLHVSEGLMVKWCKKTMTIVQGSSSSGQATYYSSVDLISIIVGTIAAATLLIAISVALVVLCWKKKVLWYVDNLHFNFRNVLTFLFTI